ncbi:MAG: cellulose synthase subunit BcsC [bacterium ADurb.Bin236]|nr:MAG: cellulose synthase subunit BcsC [bacterium ADurb.Bin236]HPN93621.1 tetratricopeptide repeat protein [bacterium]
MKRMVLAQKSAVFFAIAALCLLVFAPSSGASEESRKCYFLEDCEAAAEAALETGDDAARIEYLSQAAEFAKGERAAELRSKLAEAHLFRGLAGGADAMECYSKAIELNPDMALAWRSRGWLLLRSGNLDAAITDFNRAVELEPDDAEARGARGQALLKKGRLVSAAADFDRAAKIDPGAAAFYNRGLARSDMADYAAAVVDFDRAVAIGGPNPHFLLERAVAQLNRGFANRAMEDLRVALAADPVNLQAGYHFVAALIYAGERAAAEDAMRRFFGKGFALDAPEYDYFRLELSGLRIILNEVKLMGGLPEPKNLAASAAAANEKGRVDTAAAYYSAYLFISPENAAAAYNLAACLEMTGERRKAIQYYYRYLYLAPGAADRAEVLDAILKLSE